MIIRAVQNNELEQLPKLEGSAAQVFYDVGLDQVAEMDPTPASYYRALHAPYIILVTEDNHKLIGFIVGYEVDGCAYLKELSVDYTCQGCGIGKALLKEFLKWAETMAYSCAVLITFQDLPFNAPFYHKHGFEIFVPDHTWPQMQSIRAKEQAVGLDISPRVCMRKILRD